MNRRVLFAAGLGLAIFLIFVFALGPNRRPGPRRAGKTKAGSLYNSARSWQLKGNLDEAVKLYQELVKQFPRDAQSADAWYNLGQIYEGEDSWQKAKNAYSEIIVHFPNFKQISDVEKRLWDLNIKLLFSPIVSDKDIVYKVRPQDTLGKIAAKYSTTVDLIMRSNKLHSDLIRPGNRLKVSPAKYSIVIDKSQNTLTLKTDENVFKVYTVATGKYNSTPTGIFTITEKLKNPDWYKRGEGIVPANSPKNILGTRWLGLSEPQYGIHGGAGLKDLGQQITDGCVRMVNTDAEELFIIVPRGTEVTIVD